VAEPEVLPNEYGIRLLFHSELAVLGEYVHALGREAGLTTRLQDLLDLAGEELLDR
jgi:hypothetical protein